MENWWSYRGSPCVLDRVKTVFRFLLFLTLRVRLFCQVHSLMVFLNKQMENWQSYGGLPCILDHVKTVLRFSLFFYAENKTLFSKSLSLFIDSL